MVFQEGKNLLPAIHRLLLPVVGPVVVEKAMPGVGIHVKLIILAMLLLRRLHVAATCSGVGLRSSSPNKPRIGQDRSAVKSIGAAGPFGDQRSGVMTTSPAPAVDNGVKSL